MKFRDGGDTEYTGPCAHFALRLTEKLDTQKIAYKVHFYKVAEDAAFLYTPYDHENGKELKPVKTSTVAEYHVIVEVKVINNGKEETIFLDAGTYFIAQGNLGDKITGVIRPSNLELENYNGEKGAKLLTELFPAKPKE